MINQVTSGRCLVFLVFGMYKGRERESVCVCICVCMCSWYTTCRNSDPIFTRYMYVSQILSLTYELMNLRTYYTEL